MTVTSTQAAYLVGVPRGSLARWARRHGVRPLGRVRDGRSTVTLWALDALTRAA
jgi:hypothetical protein